MRRYDTPKVPNNSMTKLSAFYALVWIVTEERSRRGGYFDDDQTKEEVITENMDEREVVIQVVSLTEKHWNSGGRM